MGCTAPLSALLLLLAVNPPGLSAQDVELPPGVLLLSKIKRQVKQELDHLPEYTCLQTVERSATPGAAKRATGKYRLEPIDTLRLEVLYSDGKEWFASPGARNFQEKNPGAFIAGGLIGDGIFASYLHTIFVSETALVTFRGEDTVSRDRGWAKAVKYDFRVPGMSSGWKVTVGGSTAIVGSKGSFWADPETLDVLRVEIHADEIPPQLRSEEIAILLNYGRMRIGDADIMLPQSAQLRMVESSGAESLDEFDFTHCHSYQAESSISFDTGDGGAAKPIAPQSTAAAAPAEISSALPGGMTVPITLVTAVGSDSTVGTRLDGRISSDALFKGKVVIPAGSLVHGRIRRLEHYSEAGGYFAVGLEFTEVETPGALLRFYADLQSATGASDLAWTISDQSPVRAPQGWQPGIETIRLPNLPGVGSFFIRGSKFSLPAGFKMQWKTREFGK
jgi:hypothetical protein